MFIKVQFPLWNRSDFTTQTIPPETLLHAYRLGIFPMATEDGQIEWFTAHPRGIFELNEFKIPRKDRSLLKKGIFQIKINSDFEGVIRGCAERKESWISETIIQSYLQLHRRGSAHCVESWLGEKLVGGIYGVAVGGAFFGESMFYRVSNASKVALVHLVERLKERGFMLFDIQMVTPLTESFGAKLIPLKEYLRRLSDALKLSCTFI